MLNGSFLCWYILPNILPNQDTLPSDNWKHPIDHFRPENGVFYKIQYLGAYPVNISIKTVEYKNRMKIARECIKRVCSELGIIISSKKPADRDVLSSIGNKSIECGHVQVWLRITTDTISMLNQQKTEESRRHSLQDISFACGGDQELLDYLSYVAKDPKIGRACFVFQSSKDPAKDIIMTIGQAFDLRFREYQRALLGTNMSDNANGCQNTDMVNQSHQKESEWGFRPIQPQEEVQTLSNIPTKITTIINPNQPPQPPVKSYCPYNETWYLGALTRSQAEKLLKFDGDFLVRDSTQQINQYVLSGKQNGQFKHLLLVDPKGRVHTKDREFTSIKHLIEFHQQNKLPIASMDSELHLLYAISMKNDNQPR